MLRFEDKAFVRQYYHEEMTKALQAGWMLHEWVKQQVRNLRKLLEDDITKIK